MLYIHSPQKDPRRPAGVTCYVSLVENDVSYTYDIPN